MVVVEPSAISSSGLYLFFKKLSSLFCCLIIFAKVSLRVYQWNEMKKNNCSRVKQALQLSEQKLLIFKIRCRLTEIKTKQKNSVWVARHWSAARLLGTPNLQHPSPLFLMGGQKISKRFLEKLILQPEFYVWQIISWLYKLLWCRGCPQLRTHFLSSWQIYYWLIDSLADSDSSVCRCFGGQMSWDKSVCIGSTYDVTDETITHQIVDRPNVDKQYINRWRNVVVFVVSDILFMFQVPVILLFLLKILNTGSLTSFWYIYC